ncbi:MAG TPA: BatA domain-containing protein [Planctomycetota bacterium]|nr:BatA domain-containing protein [Planctomycetota bacterium]HRR82011.1 BatA domain-containing protein [Planctomycetota bacterium]HRT95090.1 BatA domain-containing protein [Planctomycetota bacterium]
MGFLDFLYKPMLWGTLAIAVPILIHLLNRYRHKRIDWAAMELLRRALVIRARQIRIEDILVLVLRCLAVLLLALAMARPTLTTAGAKWFGAEARVGVVIALDASFSMAHRPGVNTRFERALTRVRKVLSTLEPGDPVSLVLMGSTPRILLRDVGYDAARVEAALAEAAPVPERLNLELCLEEIEKLVREVRAPMRECYLVTDAQATSWEELSDKVKISLREMSQVARIFALSVASDSAENLAITHFAVASGTLRRGAIARYVAEVTNFGRQPQERVGVTLTIEGKAVDQRVIDRIPAGQAKTIPLFARLDAAGDTRLAAQLGPDPLTTDNLRYAVTHVAEQVRVLAVDGAPSDEPYKSETDFLATALSPRRGGPAAAALAVKVIPWLSLPAERLSDYQVVILANLPDVRKDQAAALHTYVQQGGGLIVFLGDKTIPRLFNARMALGEKSLLPARLTALASPKEPDGVSLEVAMPGHPVASALEGLPPELLGAARFTQYVKAELLDGGRTILKFAGTDDPLLAEKSLGRGRVLLCTSTADRDWTNFVVNPVYPIVLHQAVTYLSRQEHERSFAIAEPITLTLPRANVQANVLIRDPAGKDFPLQVSERNGQRAITLARPELPGFYEARYAAGMPPIVVAVNVEPAESDVRSLLGRDLAKAFLGTPVRLVDWGDDLEMAIRTGRVGHELWRTLMILGLAMLGLESFLAWYFSRRMVGAAARAATKDELLGGRAAEVKG